MKAKVKVTLKNGVLDPQGKAVESSLKSLGYDEVGDVRLGKYIELRLSGDGADAIRARVEEMCRSLLANEVIEDYRFDVESA